MAQCSKAGTSSPLFFLGIFGINFCFTLLLLSHIPEVYEPEDFSFVVGPTCDDTMGKSDLKGASAETIQCVRVFMQERAQEKLRGFMEIYIASLLLSVYLLHQIPKELLQAEGFKRICEIIFILATVTETILLIVACTMCYSMWHNPDGYVSSNPETVLGENMPYDGVMKILILGSLVLRFSNWVFFGLLVLLDTRGRLRDWCFEASALMHNRRFHKSVQHAYNFCFIILMNVDMLLVLYFYQRLELSAVDFSYMAGGDCDDIAGMTGEAFDLLPGESLTKRCVHEYIMTIDSDRTPAFLLCYLTVAFFYVLVIVEALSFIEGKKMKDTAKIFTAVILIAEAVFFAFTTFMTFFAQAVISLKHNDPAAAAQTTLSWVVVWMRLASMLIFYAMYLYDQRYPEEEQHPEEDPEEKETQKAEDAVIRRPPTVEEL